MSVFIDEAKIHIQSGDGGNGCVSFRREKYVPKGGPNGGDGGKGGSVIIKADRNTHTLQDFYYRPHYKAERGRDGEGADKHGRNGTDKIILVPVGSIIKDKDTGEQLADLCEEGVSFIAAIGGRGGIGNAHFATSTNRAPRQATLGEPGEARSLSIELKLIADVGLIGLPNAGKSTLISHISRARPKIAAYPFTTLIPQLGVVELDDFQSFVVADIPGLIPGAHEGMGLGDRFLRHIERTRILLHLIDISMDSQSDPIEDLTLINYELAAYSRTLCEKPQIIVGTKADRESREKRELLERYCRDTHLPCFIIAAPTGIGLKPLIEYLIHSVRGETGSA
ncbi:MAG: GTPase ObgE [bacterium]